MAMTANRPMPGIASRKSSRRLLAISVDRIDSPVTLPPGRAKLAITPPRMGSAPNAKTMGMTSVACLNVLTAIEVETMTSTLSRTNSAAISAWRAGFPSDQRYSIAMVRPSIQPNSRSRCTNAAVQGLELRSSGPESDGRQFARLLRPRCQRPRRRRAAEQRDELAPVHSITSSARASSVGGSSRPSALAVRRLTRSSSLVGCSTGRSPGEAPLKILSISPAALKYRRG